MSASLALKPGLSQRFYDWLVSLFSSEPAVRASGAEYGRHRTSSAPMPVMGRAMPDYELAEVEIVRPRSKATPEIETIAAAGVTVAPAACEAVTEHSKAVIAVPAAGAPRLAARLSAVATLNPPAGLAAALPRATAPVIKVERRKPVHRHDVVTPRPVVIVRRAKSPGERPTGKFMRSRRPLGRGA